MPNLHAQRHGSLYVVEICIIFQRMINKSDLFRNFATRLIQYRDTSNLAAYASMHLQYAYWIWSARFCLVYRIWKIQNMARRGTAVHVYTWTCRLIVFHIGIPEPGTRTWDTQAHVLYAVTERQSATQKIFAKDNACLRRSHYPATMHLQAWIVFLI